jgi:hypothetical protein
MLRGFTVESRGDESKNSLSLNLSQRGAAATENGKWQMAN